MRKIFLAIVVAVLASCATQQQISYFQDTTPNVEFEYAKGKDITVQPNDMLSIVVSSKSPELAALFNLPKIQQSAGSKTTSNQSNTELSGYTIDTNGYIDFPIIGKIHIEGLTKEEIAAKVKNILISKDLVKDPIVTVNFLNLRIYILGEVNSPGQYYLEKNQTTILEALSMAGDLTIFGQRDKVFLTRDKGNKKITYQLDMRSQDIYSSPAYYVQQNDMIYVEPNKVKANQSTVNGNTVKSASFWMSIASLMLTITVLFTK
ncbi:MAG: polysaccharide biosynthesis/export family protein [Rikenellaceae bacterium]